MENQVNSPVEHVDNIEKNDTPDVQPTDTPKAKTKKSKWESESDNESESEPRLSKKGLGKKRQKSVDSEVDEHSQPETSESAKKVKVSNEMERKKKPVWEHFSQIEDKDDKIHPSARCNYCDKLYKRCVPKRMQAHLDKCPNAPNNAKSQSTEDFNQSPSIQSASPTVEPTDMSINSTPSPTVESASQSFVERIIKPTPAPPPPMLAGCRSVDNYEKLNRIEEGAYGVVFRARDKATGEVVALKKLKLDKEKNGFPITSLREVHTLLLAKHPNIVNVREIVVGETLRQIFIVMDFIEHDLKSLMEDMQVPFLQSEVKTIMLQLLSAVAMLHDNWIIHRDLKTSNLLLNNRGQIKVADFGLARKYGSPLGPMTELVVTLWYRAPELLLGTKKYSTAVDMWSVGCIFGELVNKEPLLPGRTEIDQLTKVFKLLGMPNEKIWPGFSKLPHAKNIPFIKQSHNTLRSRFPYLTENGFDLMAKLLTYDPSKRITAEEALKHQYFTESPLPKDPEMFPTWPSKGGGERRKSYTSPSAPNVAHGVEKFDEEDQTLLGSIFENQGGNDYGFRLKI